MVDFEVFRPVLEKRLPYGYGYREDGTVALDHEEFSRPQTTLETLSLLQPSFAALAEVALDDAGTTYSGLIRQVYPDLKIDHVNHAGNSSRVVDGAAALLLASPDHAKRKGLTHRARVVAPANVGDSPTLMLNAPVPAARKVLAKAGLSVEDIDLWEINEALAMVAKKFIRDLKRGLVTIKLALPASFQTDSRCLIPDFDGALSAQGWKDALWDRFYTGAPERQRQCVERYSIVKRA